MPVVILSRRPAGGLRLRFPPLRFLGRRLLLHLKGAAEQLAKREGGRRLPRRGDGAAAVERVLRVGPGLFDHGQEVVRDAGPEGVRELRKGAREGRRFGRGGGVGAKRPGKKADRKSGDGQLPAKGRLSGPRACCAVRA